MWTKLIAILFAVGALVATACPPHPPTNPVVCWDSLTALRAEHAALQIRYDTAEARYYRARLLYAQQVAVTVHIKGRVLYYAHIVARRPASAKYMPAWTQRAFAEALLPDSSPTR